MWFLIRVRKRRSKILDMLFRLEMGLKLERLPGSRLGFLSKGKTRADLKQNGKHPSAKDKLAKCAIRLEKTSEQETIGMKSIGDDLGTMLFHSLGIKHLLFCFKFLKPDLRI